MKKIFLVIPTLGTGGGEKLVVDLAKNIDKNKFEVTLICLFSKKDSIYLDLIENNKINLIYMNKKLGFDCKLIYKLIKLFKEEKPDIVHTHLNVMPYTLPAMIFNNIKVRIHTVHSIAEMEAQGVSRIIMKIAYKCFDVIPVAICDYVKNTIIETYKLNENKVCCIYNGIDNEIFYKNHKNTDNNTINLINTGTLYYVKNHSLLIDAFAKLHIKFPNIRLTILGDGELREELEKKIKDYQLEKKIVLKGVVKNVAEELNKANIYVMTSIFEGLPLSILEAMACGLPIITTNAGGVIDIVKEDNGIIVDNNNLTQLVTAITKLLDDEKQRLKMGRKSEFYSRRYTIKNCAQQYELLYNKIK